MLQYLSLFLALTTGMFSAESIVAGGNESPAITSNILTLNGTSITLPTKVIRYIPERTRSRGAHDSYESAPSTLSTFMPSWSTKTHRQETRLVRFDQLVRCCKLCKGDKFERL